jgi:tetratricopeptide (TPR) repeat protein
MGLGYGILNSTTSDGQYNLDLPRENAIITSRLTLHWQILSMYLEPTIPRKRKRRSSPLRVVVLLLLIGAGVYVYTSIQQEEIESPFIPTPTPTRSALSYAAEAEDLYAQGRLTETIKSYEQAVALEPNDVLLYVPLTRLLILEGRLIEATQIAERAITIAPENAAAWAVLGMAYDWNGNYVQAIDACRRAVDLDPTYPEGYAYLAEAYVDAGRWADATQAAQTALQLDEYSVDAHRNYGYTLEIQGNYWGAMEAYEQALELHPNLAYIHVAVGRNYRRLGDIESALNSFKRAIEINPSDAQAHFELGWTYLTSLGDYEQAEIHFEQATSADPLFGRAFGGLAITYWHRRDYEDAIPNFERAIQLTSAGARRRAKSFTVTIEDLNDEELGPSLDVIVRGDFERPTTDNQTTLRAPLEPTGIDATANARGEVTLNTLTGQYHVTLRGLLPLPTDQFYVGWFDGINTLSGDPLSTGPLQLKADGSVEQELEATWIQGPAIDYLYTLGLAYFYKAECDKAYPLFEAALQIDPEEENALEGIRLCREAED